MTKATKLQPGITLASVITMITASAALGLTPQVTKHGDIQTGVLERISFTWDSGQRIDLRISKKGKSIKSIMQTFAAGVEPSKATIKMMNTMFGADLKKGAQTLVADSKVELTEVATFQPFLAKIVDKLQDSRLAVDAQTNYAPQIMPIVADMLLLHPQLGTVKTPTFTSRSRTKQPVDA